MYKEKNIVFVSVVSLFIYKAIFEFVFMSVYFGVFGYLFVSSYRFNLNKWLISEVVLILFIVLHIMNNEYTVSIYDFILSVFMYLCIVPMLSVYAFLDGIKVLHVIYPTIFWIVIFMCLKKFGMQDNHRKIILKIPNVKNINYFLMVISGITATIIWLWAGHPMILSLSDTTAQRLALRAASMPTYFSYPFMIVGGTILPYLVAYFWDHKKKFCSIISLMFGLLMFMTNGMKTWLFIYLFVVGIFFVSNISKDSVKAVSFLIIVALTTMLLLACFLLIRFGTVDMVSQLGRVLVIPNNIGFTSVGFFSSSDHPYLLLRESILRSLFATPYQGGSDFFMQYGANSTITSSRANNGLWGDAFRNFGIVGMLIYPALIAKTIGLIEINTRHLNYKLRYFILFLIIWGSINVSYFTWLLTGGVIILGLVLKLDQNIISVDVK